MSGGDRLSEVGRLGRTTRQTPRYVRRLGDKPLQWDRRWFLVLAVWLAVGGALLAVRVDMGHLAALTPAERAAVTAVLAYEPDGTHSCGELLAVLREGVLGPDSSGDARWYTTDRSWEQTIDVVWECSREAALTFTVCDGAVHMDDATRRLLVSLAASLPTCASSPRP